MPADLSFSTASASGASGKCAPISGAAADDITQSAFRRVDDGMTDLSFTVSLIESAAALVDDLGDRVLVDGWTKGRLDHVRNVLTVATERLQGGMEAIEIAHADLLRTRPRGQA